MGENTKIEWCDHSGTPAEKSAATKCGVPVTVWRARRAAGQQWCYCCDKWLLLDSFNKDASRSRGIASSCRSCSSHKATASRYGITVAEARDLRSGGRTCEICGRQQKLEVDHNHSTGEVRGVLCSRCNGALGQFLDDKALLVKAITYLESRDG